MINTNTSQLSNKAAISSAAINIILFVLLLLYIVLIIYYPYNAVYDEVYQMEAAQSLFQGHSYATLSLGYDLSDPARYWVISWPIAYSYALNVLMGLGLQISLAAKVLKLSITLLGIYFWRKVAQDILVKKEDLLIFMCMLVYTSGYVSSSTSDLFLFSIFPILALFMERYYKSCSNVCNSSSVSSLIASSILVSLCLVTKYSAIPIFISIIVLIIYTNHLRAFACIRDLSIFSLLPITAIAVVMLTNYLHSSRQAATFVDARLVDIMKLPHEFFSILKHFVFSLEASLTCIMMIGRVSFFFSGLLQQFVYHLASVCLLFVAINALIYVHKRINKFVSTWIIITCMVNVVFITSITVILVIRHGPDLNIMSSVHRFHYYLVPFLYISILLWIRNKYETLRVYKYLSLGLVSISIFGFICVLYDKQQKHSASEKLYNDSVGPISRLISAKKPKHVTVFTDFSYLKSIRGEFNINMFEVDSSKLWSELDSKKYFSSPTTLVLLYEKSSIDSRLDNRLVSSGFSKIMGQSSVIYQRSFEPGVLRLNENSI